MPIYAKVSLPTDRGDDWQEQRRQTAKSARAWQSAQAKRSASRQIRQDRASQPHPRKRQGLSCGERASQFDPSRRGLSRGERASLLDPSQWDRASWIQEQQSAEGSAQGPISPRLLEISPTTLIQPFFLIFLAGNGRFWRAECFTEVYRRIWSQGLGGIASRNPAGSLPRFVMFREILWVF
jgi:hypothetical protein